MDATLREISRENTKMPQSIHHEGALLIRGNAENGSFIEATDDIQIDGDILNSKVRSINGSVFVKGGIKGPTAVVQAGKDIEARLAHQSSLKAVRNIRLKKMAVEAQINAKNSVAIDQEEGLIDGGDIQAGKDIVANTIGGQNKAGTSVRLVNYGQTEAYAALLKREKETEEISKQIESLEKVIKVIRLLGDKVVMLPPEKKQDLAIQIKKYNELKGRLTGIDAEKQKIRDEKENARELDRAIIAKQTLREGVKVAIDNATLTIQKDFKNVILYRKGIVVIAEFDEYMRKKKYSES